MFFSIVEEIYDDAKYIDKFLEDTYPGFSDLDDKGYLYYEKLRNIINNNIQIATTTEMAIDYMNDLTYSESATVEEYIKSILLCQKHGAKGDYYNYIKNKLIEKIAKGPDKLNTEDLKQKELDYQLENKYRRLEGLDKLTTEEFKEREREEKEKDTPNTKDLKKPYKLNTEDLKKIVTDAESATTYMNGLISNESATKEDCIQSILLCKEHGAEGDTYNYIKNRLIAKIVKGTDKLNTEDLKKIVTDAESATNYMNCLISNESATAQDCIQSILLCQKHKAKGDTYNYTKNILIEKIAKGPDIPNTNDLKTIINDKDSAKAYMKGLINNNKASAQDCIESIIVCQEYGAKNINKTIKNQLIEKIAKGPDIPNTKELKTIINDKDSAKAYMKGLISNKSATAQDCIESIIICQENKAKGDDYKSAKASMRKKIQTNFDVNDVKTAKENLIKKYPKLKKEGFIGIDTPKGLQGSLARRVGTTLSLKRNKRC